MPLRSIAFSLEALDVCSRQELPPEWFDEFSVPEDGSWGVLRIALDDHAYILGGDSAHAGVRIVIDLEIGELFERMNPAGRLQSLRRMYRVALQTARNQRSYPKQWSQYGSGKLLTIFAYPSTLGSERIVAHIERHETVDVVFCSLSSGEHPIILEHFSPNLGVASASLSRFAVAASEASARLGALGRTKSSGVYDLDQVAHGAVTGGFTYSTWLAKLSLPQREFVDHAPNRSLKLRGPAGTGKTLAMELKVLHECYSALDEGRDIRILYVTHSWSVAEQVQDSLDLLDERNVLGRVDVVPLLTLAETELEQKGPVSILGDDSFSGKEAQLRTLARLLATAKRGDWNAFEKSCSPQLQARVMAQEGSVESNRLLWDLMLEYACVVGANGIMPGLNAERRYKQIERRPWMMPLHNDADKEFVFLLYSRMIGELLSREEMTTDQVISDYLNLLSTFRWHAERRRRGYDFIFVDEFHLFNEQERMVFHHLTRDPNAQPVIFMAMDPRQSPAETYAEFSAPGPVSGGSGESESALGEFGNIDLDVVYRYSPQILEFLRHFDGYFPALNLGADWGVSVASARAESASGPTPTLSLFGTPSEERVCALRDAASLASEGSKVAVLCLDADSFREYRIAAAQQADARFVTIESRDDVDSLRYTKKSIVLSQPHYVAGLQFDVVILGGLRPAYSQYDAYQAYGLRRFISDAYLGASRARHILKLFGSGIQADFPPVLQSAIQQQVLVET
jgi:hypothetical protein